jgi:hypothetical protein
MNDNHVQIVEDFFAAMGRGDKQALLALSAEDIFRLENGKIVAFNCYNLPSVMQQQLGLADS